MAAIVTFDPVNLRIVEIDTGGDNEVDGREIYSEWKDWLLADATRLGYPPAFSVIGGDPITGSLNAGSYFFLENGWKLRPAERDHRWTITGNVFTRDGTAADVPTLGNFQVNVSLIRSSLTQELGAPITSQQIRDAMSLAASGADVAGSVDRILAEIYKRLGLDPNDPFSYSHPDRKFYSASGDIVINVTGDGADLATETRE